MYYVLKKDYRQCGWTKVPFALENMSNKEVLFFKREEYHIVLQCNGICDLSSETISEKEDAFLQKLLEKGIVFKSEQKRPLDEKQKYVEYPCQYREQAHWSVTGHCNYRCKHCLQSAPKGVLGEPTTDQCMSIIKQMDECGIRKVQITGGEPLIRPDFLEIVDALKKHDIVLTTIYSNGKLVTDELIENLHARGTFPAFQFSFDGVNGCHDWLRGVDGAQEAVTKAFAVCRKHRVPFSAAMSVHKGNLSCIRDTVNFLAEQGCSGVKLSSICDQGEWLNEGQDLTVDELYQEYLDYIPQYFADGAPVGLQIEGAFNYNPCDNRLSLPLSQSCPEEGLDKRPVCPAMQRSVYIGPNGFTVPCMGMGGTEIEKRFPNIFQTDLKEILSDSYYLDIMKLRTGDFIRHNPECLHCEYKNNCCGGCRAYAIGASGEDYLAPDMRKCTLYKHHWDERIAVTAREACDAFIKRG